MNDPSGTTTTNQRTSPSGSSGAKGTFTSHSGQPHLVIKRSESKKLRRIPAQFLIPR